MELSNDVVLSPGQLREIVESIAKLPKTWQSKVYFDLTERYCVRLHREDAYEVWLICWDIGQDTLLHDHGGSSGAFTVAKGSLVEDYGKITKSRLRTRRHKAGKSVGFGPDYLHNLVNVGMEPTVSIHAYSPPLRVMNFYCSLPSGTHHLRAIECDTPEPDTTALEAEAATLRVAQR
ncbi:cysteine dioxygenase family protein [Kibdelosporangium aridum]|uniref:cysteine dioxygenase n=1 Tax=Kibdelosporangium aridum TaxID=2030 RepID=UPI000690CE0C|nr:cysteine dioxygenase family protein [Kibdelosporangium aridum]